MILATTLTIYMSGLITHIGDDRIAGKDLKEGAALVIAEHHVPMIWVDAEHTKNNKPVSLTLIEGDRITLKDGGIDNAGAAEASDEFRDYVPSLAEPLTNMLIHDATRSLIDHDDVIYLEYPAGDIGIKYFHLQQADFFRKGSNEPVRTQCVPAVIQFTAATTDTVTLMVTRKSGPSPDPIHLNPDAEVWLTNDLPKGHKASPDELRRHFMEYASVMKRRNLFTTRQIAGVVENHKVRCTAGKTLPQLLNLAIFPRDEDFKISDDPACTNTDWP